MVFFYIFKLQIKLLQDCKNVYCESGQADLNHRPIDFCTTTVYRSTNWAMAGYLLVYFLKQDEPLIFQRLELRWKLCSIFNYTMQNKYVLWCKQPNAVLFQTKCKKRTDCLICSFSQWVIYFIMWHNVFCIYNLFFKWNIPVFVLPYLLLFVLHKSYNVLNIIITTENSINRIIYNHPKCHIQFIITYIM